MSLHTRVTKNENHLSYSSLLSGLVCAVASIGLNDLVCAVASITFTIYYVIMTACCVTDKLIVPLLHKNLYILCSSVQVFVQDLIHTLEQYRDTMNQRKKNLPAIAEWGKKSISRTCLYPFYPFYQPAWVCTQRSATKGAYTDIPRLTVPCR